MKSWIYVFLSLFLVFCTRKAEVDPNAIPITTASDEAKEYYLTAMKLDNLEEKDSAIFFLKKAVAIDTMFSMAYLKLGMLSGDFQQRRKLIAEAMNNINNVSKGEQLWIKARNAFYGTGVDSMEIKHLQQLVNLYPNDVNSNYLYGFINYHHGNSNIDQGIEYLNKAIDINPNFTKALNELAYAYLEKSEYENARKAAKRNIGVLPNSANSYDTFAEILMREGSHEESIDAYKRVHEINNSYPWAIMGIAANYNFLDNHTTARQVLDQLESFENLTDYEFRHKWKARVTSYLDEEKIDSALIILEKQKQMGIKEKTHHEPFFHAYYSYLRKTRFYFENEDYLNGMKEYNEWKDFVNSQSTNKTTIANVLNLSQYYEAYSAFLKSEYTKALQFINNYEKVLGELDSDGKMLKSRVLSKSGRLKEAINLSRSLDLNNPYFQYYHGKFLKGSGEQKQANEWFNKIKNMNKRNDLDLALVRRRALREIE